MTADTLILCGLAALNAAAPDDKVDLTRRAAEAWRSGQLALGDPGEAPTRPARPAHPRLCRPAELPKRSLASETGRTALLHALAHIELNAIDLAWDIIVRFRHEELPRAFYDDWLTVATEEAEHFTLLSQRLADLGAAYGDLPAHDGLWQAAQETADDLLARLAVVPLVLEARGLDVTPAMIDKLAAVGDEDSTEILKIIYRDEIGHVAIGKRWFDHVAGQRGHEDPAETWRALLEQHFRGRLKPPFNEAGRAEAGLPKDFYWPVG